MSDLQKSGLSAPPVFSIKYPADWTSQTFSDDVGHLGFTENGEQYRARFNDGGRGLTPDPDLVREDSSLVVDKYTGTKSVFKIKGKIFLISADIGNQFFRTNFVFDVPPTSQEKYIRIFNQILSTFKFLDQASGSGVCKITGCSGEICSDQNLVSPCVMLPEYDCYRSAKCERQANGKCGWTQTEELNKCLGKFQSE